MTGPCPGRLHSHRPHGGLPLLTRLECPQKHRLGYGQVIIETKDGQPLTQRQLKLLRDEKSDVIQRWLEDGVAKLNADYVKCVNVHIETPNPSSPKWQTLDRSSPCARAGRTSAGRTSARRTSSGRTSAGRTSARRTSAGRTSARRTSPGRTSARRTSAGRSSAGGPQRGEPQRGVPQRGGPQRGKSPQGGASDLSIRGA